MQNYFKEDQSHFDDPALRIWMAGIWAALGEWNDAQVDLRKAYELSKDKKLLPLLALQQPPQNMSVVFDGAGPRLIWTEGEPFPEFSDASEAPANMSVSFPTLRWFVRHQERNSEIRNVVMKSNYMAQYYGLNTSVGAERTLGFAVANTVRLSGVLIGGAIIIGGFYVAADSPSSGEAVSYIMTAGLGIGMALWKQGDAIDKQFTKSADANKESGLENLRTYRFVRYLPSWISVSDKSGGFRRMRGACGCGLLTLKRMFCFCRDFRSHTPLSVDPSLVFWSQLQFTHECFGVGSSLLMDINLHKCIKVLAAKKVRNNPFSFFRV